ncbi:MAG: hypothetical protein ACRDFT_03665 [bacterium]
MTPVEWLIVGVVVVRLAFVRRAAGGLVAEAMADSALALPVFLLQEARLFSVDRWSVWIFPAVPIFAVIFGVALLGAGVTVSGSLTERCARRFPHLRSPWLVAAIDAVVLAAFAIIGEAVLFHAAAWDYRFSGPLGTIPGLDIPWAAAAGTAGFGLFFATAIRQFRRWAIDTVGRLAVFWRAVFGLHDPAADPVLAGGAAAGLGLRRAVGTVVFRFLDL